MSRVAEDGKLMLGRDEAQERQAGDVEQRNPQGEASWPPEEERRTTASGAAGSTARLRQHWAEDAGASAMPFTRGSPSSPMAFPSQGRVFNRSPRNRPEQRRKILHPLETYVDFLYYDYLSPKLHTLFGYSSYCIYSRYISQ